MAATLCLQSTQRMELLRSYRGQTVRVHTACTQGILVLRACQVDSSHTELNCRYRYLLDLQHIQSTQLLCGWFHEATPLCSHCPT